MVDLLNPWLDHSWKLTFWELTLAAAKAELHIENNGWLQMHRFINYVAHVNYTHNLELGLCLCVYNIGNSTHTSYFELPIILLISSELRSLECNFGRSER